MGAAVLMIMLVTGFHTEASTGKVDHILYSLDSAEHLSMMDCVAEAYRTNKANKMAVGSITAFCAPDIHDPRNDSLAGTDAH